LLGSDLVLVAVLISEPFDFTLRNRNSQVEKPFQLPKQLGRNRLSINKRNPRYFRQIEDRPLINRLAQGY
jgi:hypothetical protein